MSVFSRLKLATSESIAERLGMNLSVMGVLDLEGV